jgi:nicotinamidase-related amidase
MAQTLFAPLTHRTVHLCVDMQRLFSSEGVWPTPWMDKVLPVVTELAKRFPERTVFTRFITPERAEDLPGMWRRYYQRWKQATRGELDPGLLDLMPALASLTPPAAVIDKSRYSAFAGTTLVSYLQQRDCDGLIVSGSETDVCVLATVLDAVDLGYRVIGYRVILVRDAVCSSSDDGPRCSAGGLPSPVQFAD